MCTPVTSGTPPVTQFRASNGRRRDFSTKAEANAYEVAFGDFPAPPNDFDKASAAGYFDAEQQYQDACNRFGVAA